MRVILHHDGRLPGAAAVPLLVLVLVLAVATGGSRGRRVGGETFRDGRSLATARV